MIALPELLVILVVKLVARELAFDFVGDRDEKRRNIVPEEIHELIVGDDDQNVRLGGLEIRAQRRESRFGILAELCLLLEARPARRPLRRHAVVEIHEVFPLGARLEKDVGSVARRQGRD